jgi:hypothetical protein
MLRELTVVPAYGRDYTSEAEALAAWEGNKDFKVPGGPYINKSDFERHGVLEGHSGVRIRYAKLRRVTLVPK